MSDVDRIAKLLYETEEAERAREEDGDGVWVPWEAQTSRREQRIYRAMAKAVLEAALTQDQREVERLRAVEKAAKAVYAESEPYRGSDADYYKVKTYLMAALRDALTRAEGEG